MGASALMEGVIAAKGSIISGTAGSASAGSSGGPCCSLRPTPGRMSICFGIALRASAPMKLTSLVAKVCTIHK